MEQTIILNVLIYGLVLILSVHIGYAKSIPDRKPSDIPVSTLAMYFAIAFIMWCCTWNFKTNGKFITILLLVVPVFVIMIIDTIQQVNIDVKKETI